MRLYLAANAIIYSIEGAERFRELTVSWIREAYKDDRGELVTSRVSRLEARAKPLRDGNRAILALYDNLFRRATLVEITPALVERATDLSARFALRSVDSIHVASALESAASVFLTSDRRLARVSDLKVFVLE